MEAGSFEIRGEQEGGQARLSLGGELDLASAPRLQRSAEKLLEGEPRRLVVDISDLSFIDSSGLRVLIGLHERALREGWEFRVVRPPEQVLKIFQISGIDQHLRFIDAPGAEEPA